MVRLGLVRWWVVVFVVGVALIRGGIAVLEVLRADEGRVSGVPRAPRVPVAVVWPEENRLVVALREDRSVVVVDLEKGRVSRRIGLEFRPHSLAIGADGGMLIGGQDGEVEVREADGDLRFERKVGRGPVRVMGIEGGRLAAGVLWSRKVVVLDARTGEERASHEVPFETGVMVELPDGRVMVADAFRGGFATFRPGEVGSERVGRIDAVNIRGLAMSGDGGEVLMTHMATSGPTQVTRTNVDWGLILSSRLTAIRLGNLDDSRPEYRQLNLDGSGNGAADPSGMGVSADGNVIYVALSGAHEVLKVDRRLGGPSGPDLHPLGDSNRIGEGEVGQSPMGIALDPKGERVATADAMSDTVTILAAGDLKPVATIAMNEGTIQRTAVQRGEAVFLDGRRALDRWMSCASCHPGGHTIGRRFDTLGDGSYGDPKDTPSLLGVGGTAPFAWTGRFRALGDQVEQSMLTSLHGPHPSAEQVEDVVAYLGSLEPAPALRDGDDGEVRRVFEIRRCGTCHAAPTFSSRPLRNPAVEGFEGLYSTPSLRGVARTAPYFHDGSAGTLGAVLERHHPGFEEGPDRGEREALVGYLESLGGRP